MRRQRNGLGVAAGVALAAALTACGTGNGTVYVGVGVVAPWGGYPYPGVPMGPVGYPPYYWDDDAPQDPDGADDADTTEDPEAQEAAAGAAPDDADTSGG